MELRVCVFVWEYEFAHALQTDTILKLSTAGPAVRNLRVLSVSREERNHQVSLVRAWQRRK
eukprot:6198061-Pleurochrysis_carterae.AAC.3